MNWIDLAVSILSGLIILIPLVAKLVSVSKEAVREKNWQPLLDMVMKFMAEAEQKFKTGAERKEYVLIAIKASADTINYNINMDVVSEMIDKLCELSKVVNPPEANAEAAASAEA